jgi:hypothetical protein
VKSLRRNPGSFVRLYCVSDYSASDYSVSDYSVSDYSVSDYSVQRTLHRFDGVYCKVYTLFTCISCVESDSKSIKSCSILMCSIFIGWENFIH